jgi:hypothetical protein
MVLGSAGWTEAEANGAEAIVTRIGGIIMVTMDREGPKRTEHTM